MISHMKTTGNRWVSPLTVLRKVRHNVHVLLRETWGKLQSGKSWPRFYLLFVVMAPFGEAR